MLSVHTERILITGASGMIGSTLTSHLLSRGYFVRVLSHETKASKPLTADSATGNMRDKASLIHATQNIDVVIHLAARKSDEIDSEAVNVEGARHLADACLRNNVRLLINVSTQSVKLKKRGVYAETKAKADHIFETSGVPTVTLLPSVVYANLETGILGSIQSFLKLPIVPVIGDGTPTFRPMSAIDLSRVIERCIERKSDVIGKRFDAGGGDEISMNELIDLMMHEEGMKKPKLHLPIPVALAIARILHFMKRPPVTASNVLGSAENVSMNIEPLSKVTGFTPTGIREGLRVMHAEKKKNIEASSLVHYVVGIRPTPAMIERYEQAVMAHGLHSDHRIDRIVLSRKWLLQALDAVSRLRNPECVLQQKMLIAAAIAECCPQSSCSLLPKDRTKILIIMQCVTIGMKECISLVIGSFVLLLLPALYRRNAGL